MKESAKARKLGRPPNLEKRERILKLYEAGKTQADISRELGMEEAAVRYYIRELGIGPRKLRVALPAHKPKGDVKKCAICGEEKELSQFRNPKHAACRMCRYQEGLDKS